MAHSTGTWNTEKGQWAILRKIGHLHRNCGTSCGSFFLKANLQLLFFFPTPNMKNKCKSSNWINSLIFQGENHHTIATSLSVFYSVTNHDWSTGGRPILFHDFKKVSEPLHFKKKTDSPNCPAKFFGQFFGSFEFFPY